MVGLGDQVAAKVLAVLSRVTDVRADGAVTGIVSVLVFGAGTNYALLLIARYREELRHVEDRHEAMRRALGSAAPAMLASGGTVILALLALGLADDPFARSLGFAGAAGIAVALALRAAGAAGRDGAVRPAAVLAVRPRRWARPTRPAPACGRGSAPLVTAARWSPRWRRCSLLGVLAARAASA